MFVLSLDSRPWLRLLVAVSVLFLPGVCSTRPTIGPPACRLARARWKMRAGESAEAVVEEVIVWPSPLQVLSMKE